MSALDKLSHYYACSPRSVEEDVEHHLRGVDSVCILRRDLVLMARAVASSSSHAEMIDPSLHFPPELCDAWFIHILAGSTLALARTLNPAWLRYEHVFFMRGVRNSRLHCLNMQATFHTLLRLYQNRMSKHKQTILWDSLNQKYPSRKLLPRNSLLR